MRVTYSAHHAKAVSKFLRGSKGLQIKQGKEVRNSAKAVPERKLWQSVSYRCSHIVGGFAI